jgi:hypothetical protein
MGNTATKVLNLDGIDPKERSLLMLFKTNDDLWTTCIKSIPD